MTDKFIRHLISAIGTLSALVIYSVGYASGARGWWWTVITLAGVYFIVYTLVEA